jgi:hypothetical protein
MFSRTQGAAISAVVLALGVGGYASATTGSHHHNKRAATSFTLSEKTTKFTYLNLGRKDRVVGDEVVLAGNLYLQGEGQVGSNVAVCTQVTRHREQCQVTISFAPGTSIVTHASTMTVQGIFDDRDNDDLFAITGGTGDFIGVGGQIDRTPVNDTKATNDFTVVPAPTP